MKKISTPEILQTWDYDILTDAIISATQAVWMIRQMTYYSSALLKNETSMPDWCPQKSNAYLADALQSYTDV
ncbi:hypothetical protein [Coxiella endosymbiont of Ornithodoros amblus]|uniref:hypothetical protein n=1 Tax=Coxiella endosymbiont of Ornithodoros amblus TaxID=1656166 RepID=UPI00244DB6B5|nr:hypothetical protein [Coxiella endosymbiont of Ornithodoros amblus]